MKRPKIIAEIGINHNGQLKIAFEMISRAAAAGADLVKFQMRSVEVVYHSIWNEPRNDGNPYGWKTQGEQKSGLEFSAEQYLKIDEHCKREGIPWFASAWDVGSLGQLAAYKCPYNKIASAMLTNKPFVEAVAAQGKKTFISIGGSFPDDVRWVIDKFKEYKTKFVIMHCVALYPVPYDLCNMGRINTLMVNSFIDDYDVGYSGHEVGLLPSIVALALGAQYIERHISIDRSMYGSDQAASLEIPGLIKLVEYAKIIPDVMGSAREWPLPEELAVLKKMRYWEQQ